MLKEFKGKTALITGAAHGFGREYALEAARRGMQVVLFDIDRETMLKTEGELKALGARTLAIHGDVTRYEEIKAAVRQTVETFKTIDLLINNAGVYYVGRVTDVPVEDVRWMLDTNILSIFYTLHEVIPVMAGQGTDAHILNVASLAGLMTAPNMSAYHASKHAVVAASEAIYGDLKKTAPNVGISIFCPGYVQTGLHRSWEHKPDHYGKSDPYYETETYKKNVSRVERYITTGAPIDFVAPAVFEAIEQGQFYIFPGETNDVYVAKRHADILNRRNPD